MLRFEMSSSLPIEAEKLARDLFCMDGVNYELLPLVKMSAPKEWKQKNIRDWPIQELLFKSYILLFGFIPIDLHSFKLHKVTELGFDERSKSLMNLNWNHSRHIAPDNGKSIVRDVVKYQSKLKLFGILLKPVYKFIFEHRHKRLRSKYMGDQLTKASRRMRLRRAADAHVGT